MKDIWTVYLLLATATALMVRAETNYCDDASQKVLNRSFAAFEGAKLSFPHFVSMETGDGCYQYCSISLMIRSRLRQTTRHSRPSGRNVKRRRWSNVSPSARQNRHLLVKRTYHLKISMASPLIQPWSVPSLAHTEADLCFDQLAKDIVAV